MKIEDNKPLARWLEEGLKAIYDGNATSIAILATLESGEILNSYYRCGVSTKLLYAGYINQDAMMDTLEMNACMMCEEDCDDEINEVEMSPEELQTLVEELFDDEE